MRDFMTQLKHAFAVTPEPGPGAGELPGALESIARKVVERGLETPAIIFFESIRPLNFIASQTLLAAWPIVKMAGGTEAYQEVAEALEDRETLHRLVLRIEELAATGDSP